MSSRYGYEAKGMTQKWINNQQERIYSDTSESGINKLLKYGKLHKVA